MTTPLTPDDRGHLHSVHVCPALGVSGPRLRELADREGIEHLHGLWGVDEVKQIARRLIVSGSAEEKAHARTVLRDLTPKDAG